MRKIMMLILFFLSIFILSCSQKPLAIAPEVRKEAVPAAVPSGRADWEVRWEKILAEARKEGVVVVYGPPDAETRRGFTEAFQKAYPGIMLEYTGMTGSQTSPKIKAERRAGLYTVDLHIGGTTTMLTQLKEFAVPIKPLLIVPSVTDPKIWLGGKLDFADEAEEINLAFTLLADSRVVYNTELVDPKEITSWWDLVKPKWKGKIIMWDPRAPGSGLATASFWYLHPQLGLDYLKAFAANQPVFTRDLRLHIESVARGRYSIANSPDIPTAVEFLKAGMPIKWAPILREGTYSTAAFGSVIVMDKAPHPNAAIVFLNWLLGKEGQTIWATKGGYASRRLDVTTDHLIEALKPDLNASYSPNYKEAIVMKKDEVARVLNEIFGAF